MSLEFIEYVISLPFQRQIIHWSSPKPWMHEGKPVRLPAPDEIKLGDITVSDGNVVRLTKTVLLPCFGSPTAYLRHGGEHYVRSRNGGTRPSRCTRCGANAVCENVAKSRLRASPEIRDAWDAWEDAGGRTATRKENNNGMLGLRWRDLVRALTKHGPFDSVNDARIRHYVDGKLQAKRDIDASRKRRDRQREREKRTADGNFDDELLERLRLEAIDRRLRFERAREHEGAPPWISRGMDDTASFTARVWMVQFLIVASRRKANASNVAAELIARRLVETTNHNALRSRVGPALSRVHRLEKVLMPWSGQPVWERANLNELLRSPEELG